MVLGGWIVAPERSVPGLHRGTADAPDTTTTTTPDKSRQDTSKQLSPGLTGLSSTQTPSWPRDQWQTDRGHGPPQPMPGRRESLLPASGKPKNKHLCGRSLSAAGRPNAPRPLVDAGTGSRWCPAGRQLLLLHNGRPGCYSAVTQSKTQSKQRQSHPPGTQDPQEQTPQKQQQQQQQTEQTERTGQNNAETKTTS